jgi:hypothetical protein
VKNSVKASDSKNWCMVFTARMRVVVVTAGKGRSRNETLISVYVVSRMTLLTSCWTSLTLTKKKQPVFGCCNAGGWCQRKLKRFIPRSLKWAKFVSCYFLIFGSLSLLVSRTRERTIFVTVYRDWIGSVLDS